MTDRLGLPRPAHPGDVRPVGHLPAEPGEPLQNSGLNVGFGEGSHRSMHWEWRLYDVFGTPKSTSSIRKPFFSKKSATAS